MKSLKFALKYTKRHTKVLTFTIVSMLLLVGVQLFAPWIIKTMVGTLTESGVGPEAMQRISRLAMLAFGVYLARAVLQFLRSYLAHVAGWGVVAEAQRDIYAHLQRLSLSFYEDKKTGELMSRALNDTRLFEQLIAHAVPDVIVNILSLIGVSAVLISLNWQLMLLSLIPVPLIVIAMQGISKYVRPAFRARQDELGELNATLSDNFSGIREIKAFTREDIEMENVGERINRYRDSLLYALRMMALFRPFVGFVSSLGTVGLIYFGGRLALNQTLPLEDLVAFFLYLDLFYQPVRVLSGAWEGIQEALAGAERVEEMLHETPDVQERPDAIALQGRAEGAITLRDVAFKYEQGEPVLEDINLEIAPGETIALVGPTGVGKTTLANLIPRFYDVAAGAITLDGRDVRDLTLKSLREQISIVRQEVFLFHGTVRENILFGNPDAAQAEIIEAAKIANAHGFILDLPDGYDTLIGERGVKLSGGQRQRLAIARAILKDAPILILDEATSAVDAETEALIQQALERLMAGRTTIVIAHRLSTIRNADLICFLEGSKIVEMGAHEALMARDGLYRRLNEVQIEDEPKWRMMQEQQQRLMASVGAPVE
jgi:ATP-binding cassette, subfamily B, bacterial